MKELSKLLNDRKQNSDFDDEVSRVYKKYLNNELEILKGKDVVIAEEDDEPILILYKKNSKFFYTLDPNERLRSVPEEDYENAEKIFNQWQKEGKNRIKSCLFTKNQTNAIDKYLADEEEFDVNVMDVSNSKFVELVVTTDPKLYFRVHEDGGLEFSENSDFKDSQEIFGSTANKLRHKLLADAAAQCVMHFFNRIKKNLEE